MERKTHIHTLSLFCMIVSERAHVHKEATHTSRCMLKQCLIKNGYGNELFLARPQWMKA